MRKIPAWSTTSAANSGFTCIAVAARRSLVRSSVPELWQSLDLKVSCLTCFSSSSRSIRISSVCCGVKEKTDDALCFSASKSESTRLKLLLPKLEKPFNKNPNLHPNLWVRSAYFTASLLLFALFLPDSFIVTFFFSHGCNDSSAQPMMSIRKMYWRENSCVD